MVLFDNYLFHIFVGVSSYFEPLKAADPNCVVIGDAEEEFSYSNVNNAFRVLMKMPEPLLISLGNGLVFISFF